MSLLNQNSLPDSGLTSEKTNYFLTCNGGRNGGFGDAYIDEKHFQFAEINEPVRKRIFYTLLGMTALNAFFLYMCYYVYIWGLPSGKKDGARLFLLIVSCMMYLFMAFTSNEMTEYITNTKDYADFDGVFSSMAKESCFVKFVIQCYHYQKSGKNKKTVITHKASQEYYFEGVDNNSGEIKEVKTNKLMFVHYDKKFSFGNPETKEDFVESYNAFALENIRDQHQSFVFSLQVPGFQEHVCYNRNKLAWINPLFYLCLVCGLAAPFLIILEFMVERYEVRIHKILSK